MRSYQLCIGLLLLAACATAVPTNFTSPTEEPTTSLECGPIDRQILQGCRTCPATCSNPGLICPLQCVPGCGCPSGQLIDEENMQCVEPEDCPDPCDSVKCPVGTYCEVDTLSNKALCVPSCKIDNGGCQENETCELVTVYCIRAPCPPPFVRCVDEEPEPTVTPTNPVLCPIAGQVFQTCQTCPATCSNPDLICTLQCVPGCGCPPGQLIDEVKGKCVEPRRCPKRDKVDCDAVKVKCAAPTCSNPIPPNPARGRCCSICPPDTCSLLTDVGPCKANVQRYFYNATSKQCEQFTYGGCFGNKNNFATLESCEKKCSECPPTCTVDFCKGNMNAKCSIPDNNTTKKTFNCFGGCDETVCSACYFSTEILPLPSLAEGCPNVCESDFSGETHSMICLWRWGTCVRSANLDIYGKPSLDVITADNFKCWRPSCPLIQIG